MLVITRRVGESIIINDKEVIFKVLGIRGNQIKVGVDAADRVSILREELYERIKAKESNDQDDGTEGGRKCEIVTSKLET